MKFLDEQTIMPLFLDRRGGWFDDDRNEVIHPAVIALFDACVSGDQSGGFQVKVDGRSRRVIVEDCPVFVSSAGKAADGSYVISVRNREVETLDPASLRLDDHGLTADIGCGLRARFLRQAYIDLAMHMEEDEDGSVFLPLEGGARAYVKRRDELF